MGIKKIVIVGGVAGGATAATKLRRLDEQAQIVLFERGEYVSFANCGLPYYIGGKIQERQKLLVQTIEGMENRYKLEIRNQTEVTSLNRHAKTITAKNLVTGEIYEESYDYLLLSPGAKPIVPEIDGLTKTKNVFTLRNIPDTDKIKTYVSQAGVKQAVIIGGGFIGLEMADNLHQLGLLVTVVEKGNQVMGPLDIEMASIVHHHLRQKGVKLIFENGVKSFSEEGLKITLEDGTVLTSDVTILSIGVQPESQLAKDANLAVSENGGIVVNEYFQTDDASIYAVGDAIEVTDEILRTKTRVPLAWGANRQGRLVADYIYGNKKGKYTGALGTAVAKVFDLTVASTGVNEKTLKKQGLRYEKVHVHPASHAGYYPGATPVSIKLIFHPETGALYGAQAIGENGVEKRIDVIATALKFKATVYDLPDLELSYAPPYSSAKDPVNMVGYVATNIVDNVVKVVHFDEVDQLIQEGNLFIDLRDKEELEQGYIKGGIQIPLNELRNKISELPKNKKIILSCQVGYRGYIGSCILAQEGFDVSNLSGGFKTYSTVYPERVQFKS